MTGSTGRSPTGSPPATRDRKRPEGQNPSDFPDDWPSEFLDFTRRACVLLTDQTRPQVILLGRLSLYGDRAVRLHDTIVATAAVWTDPQIRRTKLAPLGEGAKEDVLGWVEESLASPGLMEVGDGIKARLLAGAARDVQELLPALNRRSETLRLRAERDLTERGSRESTEIVSILESQKERVSKRIAEIDKPEPKGTQVALPFAGMVEERQYRADRKHLAARLGQIDAQKLTEPERITRSYNVISHRLEPIGLVYLWPVSS